MVPLRRGSEEVRVARRISTHVGQRIRRRAVVIVHTRVDAAHREAVDVRRVFVTGRRVCAIRLVVAADQATIQQTGPGRHGGDQQQRQHAQCPHTGMILHCS